MVTKAPTKEELAQVRRMRAQKPYVPPEAIIEAASRTPTITRFIQAKQRRLEQANSEASPITTSPHTAPKIGKRGLLAKPVDAEALLRGGEIKTHFQTSRRVHDRKGIAAVDLSNRSLPHTPVTSQPERRRFPCAKKRRDIYDLPDDDPSITAAHVQEAPSPLNPKRPSSKQLHAEPDTSSFHYPDTPSPPKSQESHTIEECLKAARETSEVVSKVTHKTQSHSPAQGTSGSKFTEKITTESQGLPLSPLQDEQFTGRDLEILHLSEDDQAFPSTGFPNGTKRQRTAIEQENYDDLGQFAGDADGESDAHLEEPLRKKRRRSSRDIPRVKARNTALQKLAGQRISRANRKSTMNRSKSTKTYGTSQKPNKQKRRLPANELVTVTRRPGSSDIEVTSSRHAGLSQDPISQQVSEQELEASEIEHRRSGLRVDINFRRRKRIGAIDISLFRIPKSRNLPTATSRQQLVNSCSDGFEEREAAPIGLYMPLKRPARRREAYRKITMRLGELTLVPERPEDGVQVEVGHHPRRKLPRRRVNPATNTHVDSENALSDPVQRKASAAHLSNVQHQLLDNPEAKPDQDRMLVDGQGEGTEVEFRAVEEHQFPSPILPERNTPTATSNREMSQTPTLLVSPLKRKQSAVHNDRASIDVQRAQKFASQIPVGMEDIRISQRLAMTSTKRKTPLRARTRNLEIAQKLMMVSVRRRPRESRYESDNSADESKERNSAESYSESESESEEVSEEDEEELMPEEDSEQGENEVEEETPQIQEDELVAEGAGCDNHLQFSVRTGSEMSHGAVGMSVKLADSIVAETRQEFSHTSPESQDDGDENISDAPRTRQEMVEMASQALLSVPTEMKTTSQAEVSLSDDCRPEIQGNEEAVNRSSSQQKRSQVMHSEPHDDPSSSLRPRVSDTSGFAMDVDDEIMDSPAPAPFQERQVFRRPSSRRPSGYRSSQLTMVRSRRNSPVSEEPTNPHDTQGSVELGASQWIVQRSPSDVVSERLLRYQPEIPETQFSVVEPQLSYMERALEQLSSPVRRPNPIRTKSMLAHVLFAPHGQSSSGLIAGGITMAEAFHHTVSPLKSGNRLPTLREECSSEEKSLRSLARKASVKLGTMPGSARRRTVSLQFKPPFRPSTV